MKKLISIIVLSCSFAFSQEKYQKIRIYYNSDTELQQIIREYEIDHYHQKKNTFIECEISANEVENLKQSGKKIDIVINDMQQFIQNNISAKINNVTCINEPTFIDPINYKTGSMAGFLTYQECLDELSLMHSLYPNLITLRSNIGTFSTFENRALQFVKISDNPSNDENEKRILYTAMHHAREPGSMQQLIYFMWYLLENYATNLEIKNLVDTTEIFCVPVVNPDGFVHNQTTNPEGGGMWRKNRRDNLDTKFGVDNNRNYDYQWGTVGISLDTNSDVYCGTEPFSESENKAIKWLCDQKNFLVAMNAHTFSSLVLYPFGTEINLLTPDDNIFKGISNEMVKFNNYKNQLSSALYPTSGTSDDWMYGNVSSKSKIFAFTPEVGRSFWDSPAQTAINNRDMLHTNLTALKFLHNYGLIKDLTSNLIGSPNYNFEFSLNRLGLVENENFNVSINPISSNILTVSQPQNFSNLAYNTPSLSSFLITLKPITTAVEQVVFEVILDNGSLKKKILVTKYYGNKTIVFQDNGNNLNQWTTSSSDWGTTTSTFVSAGSSFTDSPTGQYAINKNSIIFTTNPINLSNASYAEITFSAKWNIEKDYDYGVLEIKKNNEAWQPQCTNFTRRGSITQIINKPIYDGLQENWIQDRVNLSEYVGSNISLQFRVKSDSQINADGFYFDDLKVNIIKNPSLNTDDFSLDQILISPNPTNNSLSIINNKDIENFKIYNLSGQLLANEKLVLDKIDVSFLTNGIYFLELQKDNKKRVLKFIKD